MTRELNPGEAETSNHGVATERPKAGDLTLSATADDAWDVAMSGDAGAAIRSGLIAERERTANALHYKLVKLRDEFDNAARQLEAGRRQYVISRSNWFADLPVLIEQLDTETKAVENAERLAGLAERHSPKAAAYRLERAAQSLDMVIGGYGLEGEHALATSLRAEAARIVAEADDAARRAREEREERVAAERARRVARPLGATERKLLSKAENGPIQVGRWNQTLERKAITRLVERGFLSPQTRDEQHGTHHTITDEGLRIAATL